MVKKILFILFLSVSFTAFSQEKTVDNLSTAPNPFTSVTNITFNSVSNSSVILTVRNVLGKTVFKKTYNTTSGKNKIPFYKNDLATGMYIYSIQNNKKVISKRFVIK
ncbi:T9SS type A sorting domain-containing protein [Polaribacter sp. KT 15]|uniref:T9SS type A sorting domain-containing protein n=1 Tax=Polaribacter sp. KT 15 TaxID=1896175 RepID=UPI00090A8748|nr:T9SS type A sorting domain-containing protein [Polaribacter sp. KT 15]SHM75411.1 Por secretion system C-terminal sorting domain-containing protein [Polaribacter sp. KT 15]